MQFDDDDTSDINSSNFDGGALPFPKPLERSTFLAPTFSAADFLSSLTSRFQTLEDLQTELQDLLKSLNKDLVDLVNDNYTDFLGLGEKLKGGEEKVEEIRVGLLGFQRDVTGIRDLVNERSNEVRALLDDKRHLRKSISTGRTLLEIEERLGELESRLSISRSVVDTPARLHAIGQKSEQIGGFKDWSDEWIKEDDPAESSTEDEEEQGRMPDITPRLMKNLNRLRVIVLLSKKCGERHPFIVAQRDRLSQVRDGLGKDLENAIRTQSDIKVKQRIIQLRAQLDD